MGQANAPGVSGILGYWTEPEPAPPSDGLDYTVMSYELARDLCECFNGPGIPYTSVQRMAHRVDCAMPRWQKANPGARR